METLTLLILFLIIPCIMTGIGIAIYRYYDKKDQSFENSIPEDEWWRIKEIEELKDYLKERRIKRILNPESVTYNEI